MVSTFLLLFASTTTIDEPTAPAAELLPRIAQKLGEHWSWDAEFADAPLFVRAKRLTAPELRAHIAHCLQARWERRGHTYHLVPDEAARTEADTQWLRRMEEAWPPGRPFVHTSIKEPDPLFDEVLSQALATIPPREFAIMSDLDVQYFSTSRDLGDRTIGGHWIHTLQTLPNELMFSFTDECHLTISFLRDGAVFEWRAHTSQFRGSAQGKWYLYQKDDVELPPLPVVGDAEWRSRKAEAEPLSVGLDSWARGIPGNVVACWPARLDVFTPAKEGESAASRLRDSNGQVTCHGDTTLIRPRQYDQDRRRRTSREAFRRLLASVSETTTPAMSQFIAFASSIPESGLEPVLQRLYRERRGVLSPEDRAWPSLALRASLGMDAPEREPRRVAQDDLRRICWFSAPRFISASSIGVPLRSPHLPSPAVSWESRSTEVFEVVRGEKREVHAAPFFAWAGVTRFRIHRAESVALTSNDFEWPPIVSYTIDETTPWRDAADRPR